VFVCSFFRTEGALSGFIGIVSAAIGFLIGAYMPLHAFPDGVEYIAALLPGTHSAGLFRNFLMSGALADLTAGLPQAAYDGLMDAFSMRLDLFGKAAGTDVMALYVAGSILLFAALNLVVGTKFLNLSASDTAKKLFKRKKS